MRIKEVLRNLEQCDRDIEAAYERQNNNILTNHEVSIPLQRDIAKLTVQAYTYRRTLKSKGYYNLLNS